VAILDIKEYQRMPVDQQGAYIQTGIEPGIKQQITGLSGVSAQSAAFDQSTLFIRVHADVVARVEIGVNPTADGTSMRLAAGATEYFGVRPGQKVAAITST
jgi:hypothetical protein